jgi:2-keto-3-deoxy-L-rhamnonate aldolase RhmA
MPVTPNITLERLRKGELALGFGVRQARTVDIAKIAKTCGYDWFMLDLEHNTMTIDLACQIAVAALDAGVTPLVRVPGHEHHHATRVLDGGAMGVIVPHVDTAEQARQVVRNCKYPPVGSRSVAGGMPQLGFAAHAPAETIALLNPATLLVVMLETPEAIANVEEIAAVDGIDVLLVGTNDLCATMGIPGQFGSERVSEAYREVIEAARRHGKFPGMGGVYDPALMERYIAQGMQFVLAGGDLAFLMAAATQRAQFLRALQRP